MYHFALVPSGPFPCVYSDFICGKFVCIVGYILGGFPYCFEFSSSGHQLYIYLISFACFLNQPLFFPDIYSQFVFLYFIFSWLFTCLSSVPFIKFSLNLFSVLFWIPYNSAFIFYVCCSCCCCSIFEFNHLLFLILCPLIGQNIS